MFCKNCGKPVDDNVAVCPYCGTQTAPANAQAAAPAPEAPATPGTGPLAGKRFVITGTLSQPRETFERLIRENGGSVQSSVSRKTDYLLVGADPGGGKFDKAQALGTPQLDEAAFHALLGEAPTPPVAAPTGTPAPIQDDLFGDLA